MTTLSINQWLVEGNSAAGQQQLHFSNSECIKYALHAMNFHLTGQQALKSIIVCKYICADMFLELHVYLTFEIVVVL